LLTVLLVYNNMRKIDISFQCVAMLLCLMECDLVYEGLGGFIPFQNIRLEVACIVKFSEICLSGLLRTSSLMWST
jgi:hypothetical protein